MKKFLTAQEGVTTKKQLQREFGRFYAYYGCKSSGSSEGSRFGDELAIGPFGMDGDLLLADALVSRGVNPAAAALAASRGCSGREFHPSPLLCGERGSAEAVLLVLCEHVPEEDHEQRIQARRGVNVATVAAAKARSGPGFRATTQANSTRAQRAPALGCLEIEP